MKKIMFNDKYRLTQAVLEGRKTQTRRIIKSSDAFERVNPDFDWDREDIKNWENSFTLTVQNMSEEEKKNCFDYLLAHPKYKVGEVVAVAQRYRDCDGVNENGVPIWEIISSKVDSTNAGWDNKMFVMGDLMPHKIRITDVRVERLQDISDECCLKEGVVVNEPKIKGGINMYYPCEYLRSCAKEVGWGRVFHTPREAFAHLINKVSKKDVWSENPYVFVYDFELVK